MSDRNVEDDYTLQPSSGKGLLALSFTTDSKDSEQRNMNLFYRQPHGLTAYGQITLWTNQNPLDWNDPKGRLVVIEVPEGPYEFFSVASVTFQTTDKFSIPFTITAGKVTYLGNIHVTVQAVKRFFTPFQVTVEVRNLAVRDVPLLLQRYPKLTPTDVGRSEARLHKTSLPLQYSTR